jgi:hypothetical protein
VGKLDNTLIIYISGDNGTSAEGTLEGTPNQMTAYNGILDLPEIELMRYYEAWGSEKTYPHMSVAWSWEFDNAVQMDQAGGVALWRHKARHGYLMAWPHHGPRRHPQPVPVCPARIVISQTESDDFEALAANRSHCLADLKPPRLVNFSPRGFLTRPRVRSHLPRAC